MNHKSQTPSRQLSGISCKLILVVLGSFALLQKTQAVVPPPDGGYPGFNTAEGQSALFSLTSGGANTAVGWFSLSSVTTGNFNTGVGAGTLVLNTGDENTAIGTAALLLNTASGNTAVGSRALSNNTTGVQNTAVGLEALTFNNTGQSNTALGDRALFHNTTGRGNTGIGSVALFFSDATTVGNTALGDAAGYSLTGDGNVCIGAGVAGVAGESNTTWIRNIWGQPGGIQAVYVDPQGRLGANTSSRRFKEEIKPMDKASEAIYSLKPVSFRYKKEIEATRPLSFGLIAEDVEQADADLVLRGKDGKVSTVRYEAVNAMLLNEFLKEHKRVEKLESTVTTLAAIVKEQTAQIQEVSAHLRIGGSTPEIVASNP